MANRFSFENLNLGSLEDLRPQIPETSITTPKLLPQNKTDIIGKILGFAKSQFQKSQEALAIPIPGSDKYVNGGIAIDPTGMLGMKRVGGEIVKKAPQIIKIAEEVIIPEVKGLIPKIAQISSKIAQELPEGIEKITKRGVQITKEFANYAKGL